MLHHHWQWNLKRNSRPGAQPVYDEAASMWVKALALAGISGGLACLLFILSLSSPRAAELLPALQENSGEVGEHFVFNSNACNVTQRCGVTTLNFLCLQLQVVGNGSCGTTSSALSAKQRQGQDAAIHRAYTAAYDVFRQHLVKHALATESPVPPLASPMGCSWSPDVSNAHGGCARLHAGHTTGPGDI